ncbi:hypothetical protein EDD85DRAFT_955318 [Armillaria nabsnona]|nr:hypothetical protein EDD85DRAFT_955318 [Armillaria nabsnona]
MSTATSCSYSIRDAVTDLIMLLPNIRTAAFFNVVLDELPIYFGDCDHIKYLKLIFCRASIKGMNTFMNHFGHLDIMQLYLPEPTLSPLYFYNTQFLLLPAPGVNALEWFSDPTTWYDPSGLTSFHIVGNADHTNVTTFLKKVGPLVRDISSISTGDTKPFDLSYTPKLLTLTLDIDMINMGQIHVSLLSLPKHSNLNNLTIVIRGPYFIPKIPTTIQLLPDALKSRCNWMRSFTVVYETTWSIINETEFTRLAWILTSVFRNVFCHAVVDFQLQQEDHRGGRGLHIALKDLSEPFSCLLKKTLTVVERVHNLYDGHVLPVVKLSKESEEELIGAALEKYSIEEVKRMYCFLQMTK